MEKTVRVLKSFEECDRTDKEYYHGLTPRERLEILLELNRRWSTNDDVELAQRLEKVYRIVNF